jgi:hypothetical protein
MEYDATPLIMHTEEKTCKIDYNACCSISISEAKVDYYFVFIFQIYAPSIDQRMASN